MGQFCRYPASDDFCTPWEAVEPLLPYLHLETNMSLFTNRHLASDEFYTPYGAVEPLLPYLPRKKVIWECAYGTGELAGHLRSAGFDVVGSAETNFYSLVNFQYDLLVTNPPYSDIDAWLRHAFDLGKPFAFLLPIETLAGNDRARLFKRHPISFLILPKRVRFVAPNGRNVDFFVAWFCWQITLPSQVFYA